MHIQVMNRCCAKVELASDECAVFGIDYDSFSGSDTASRLFIASVLQKMEEMELSVTGSDKLTAEIFRRSGGGLIVYISGKGLRLTSRAGERVIFCETPSGVIAKLGELPEPESAELYKYAGRYALISRESDPRSCTQPYICAKIKEYGELLSDTPYQLLFDVITHEER
ncbi:MAG: hypothetical protein IJ723_08275 [Ruminococcus sp.]|nr:hypothetical protein [Ruminococcus sp.]